ASCVSTTLAGWCGAACDGMLACISAAVYWSARIPGGSWWVAGPPDWWVAGWYAALLATLLPFTFRFSGWIYFAAALVLGAWFVVLAWRLWRDYSDALARQTFRFSIWHLSLLFAALLVDHWVGPWLFAG
ncbi:MAG: hypothetical protein ACOVOU_11975, partial [Rubrivivax sp.]